MDLTYAKIVMAPVLGVSQLPVTVSRVFKLEKLMELHNAYVQIAELITQVMNLIHSFVLVRILKTIN